MGAHGVILRGSPQWVPCLGLRKNKFRQINEERETYPFKKIGPKWLQGTSADSGRIRRKTIVFNIAGKSRVGRALGDEQSSWGPELYRQTGNLP